MPGGGPFPLPGTALRSTAVRVQLQLVPGVIITDMATPPKRGSAPAGKRTAKPSPEPPGVSSQPSLRFRYSADLHERTLAVLAAVEQAEDASAHRDALAEVVVELTKSGLDAYFMQPLQEAEAGYIVRQSANLGLSGAEKVMGSVIRSIIGRMDPPQVLSVCASIRRFML
jgi:hypothetical protein